MDNTSAVTAFMQATAALIHQFPVFQQMADFALKSFFLMAVFLFVDAVVGRKLSNTSRHLLWLNALLCLALFPILAGASGLWGALWPGSNGDNHQSALFELPVYASSIKAGSTLRWDIVLLIMYLIPAALLISRLMLSLRSLKKILARSQPATHRKLTVQLNMLRHQLNISRKVGLRFSSGIESPVSFGLFRPEIVLPAQASQWNRSTMSDVLLHELCHIRRLDWLTTLFAYAIACVFWFNPLVWVAVRRLRDESEHSCDTAVLNAGRSDTDYAESLLGVASSCIHARRHNSKSTNRNSNPLMQTMLDQNTLKTRISRVLEENKMNASEMKKEIKKTAAVLFVMSVGVLGALGSTQVLLAQQQSDPAMRPAPATRAMNDVEMLPLNTIQPRYPTVAAEAGIEGWVHLIFTVGADGLIPESSVNIVDAEPADIFNNSAIAAIKQFRFSPRIRAGQPVDVPNVQYVFRYQLQSEESESAAQQ